MILKLPNQLERVALPSLRGPRRLFDADGVLLVAHERQHGRRRLRRRDAATTASQSSRRGIDQRLGVDRSRERPRGPPLRGAVRAEAVPDVELDVLCVCEEQREEEASQEGCCCAGANAKH